MPEIFMTKCMPGWILEVLTFDEDGKPLAQVCRQRGQQVSDWTCQKGWEKIETFPYCKRPQEDSLAVVISEKYHLLFVFIPHTDSYYITKYLAMNEVNENQESVMKISETDLIQSKVRKMSLSAIRRSFTKYYKATMVQHPCSRLYSAWKYFTVTSAETIEMWTGESLGDLSSFEGFIENVLYPARSVLVQKDVHLRPQVDLLFGLHDEIAVDEVLYFERWEDSIKSLPNISESDTFNMPPPMNTNLDCEEIYTSSAWFKMKEIYYMDFCVLGYYDEMDKSKEIPSSNLPRDMLNDRFKSCQMNLESFDRIDDAPLPYKSLNRDEDKKFSSEKCTIHTYYQSWKGKKKDDEIAANITLEIWKTAWTKAGWTPRIISEDDASSHPEFEALKEQFSTFPSANSAKYELNCFLRYVAMANIGGGWMTDFDVLPIRFPPCTEGLFNGRFTIYHPTTPCLVSATPDEYLRVVRLMANVSWKGDSHFMAREKPHVSDMHCILRFLEKKLVNKLNVVVQSDTFLYNENFCNASYGPLIAPIPSTMSTKPWAVHFSHFSAATINRTITSLSRELIRRLDASTRFTLMGSAFAVFNDTCHFYD